MNRSVVQSSEAQQIIDRLLVGDVKVGDVTIVNRSGEPIAVVLTPESYRRLVDLSAERDWFLIDELRARNRHHDPGEIERDIDEVVEEVRRERWIARQQSS